MKNKLCFFGLLLIVVTSLSATVWAQTRIYNSSNSNYNASGPLNLKGMLQGNKDAATGVRNNYYGGEYYGGKNYRPYGMDNPNFDLGLTTEEVRDGLAKRAAEARKRERQSTEALAKYNDELADYEKRQAKQTKQREAGKQQGTFLAPAAKKGRRVYDKKEQERFKKPPKVFNFFQ